MPVSTLSQRVVPGGNQAPLQSAPFTVTQDRPVGDWVQPLYSCRGQDECHCFYSFCCSPLAIAESRRQLDGSDVHFNELCLNVCVTRWLIRSAYNIPGSALNDCLVSTFCYPCVANQMFATTYEKGAAEHLHDGGYTYNREKYESNWQFNCHDFMYACCCMPCATGTAMEIILGMPWYLGCCCVSPCAASQLMRYHYRIKGSDVGGDCLIPVSAFTIGLTCTCSFCGIPAICMGGVLFSYSVGSIMTMFRESRAREGNRDSQTDRHKIRYLSRRINFAAASPLMDNVAGGGSSMQLPYLNTNHRKYEMTSTSEENQGVSFNIADIQPVQATLVTAQPVIPVQPIEQR